MTLLAQDPLAVDPSHYKVELDNSRVRVLRVHYKPGEGSPMHEHSAGVRIFLTDIHNKFFLPDGSTSEASRHAGEIIWAEPVRHGNQNVGDNAVEILEMELKGLPKHPAHGMAASAPSDPSETVVLENEFVRVLRVRSEGRQKGSHAHPDEVIVSGKGQVFWAPASETLLHAPQESAIVELKQK
jgi:hypothetical protein